MLIDGILAKCCSGVGLDYILQMSRETHVLLQVLTGNKKLVELFKDFRIQLLEIDARIF
jgi:hypothetical protein